MKISNTWIRIIVSLVTIPVITFVSYTGNYYFFSFVLLIGLLSYYEYRLLVKSKNINVSLIPGLTAVLLIIINSFLFICPPLILFFLIVTLILLEELFLGNGSAINNLGGSFLGIFFIGLFSSSLILIREHFNQTVLPYESGGYLIISILATIWICDSAAFFVGTAIGKHKIFPRVSPNKSVEGSIAGFVFAIISIAAAKLIVLDFLSWEDIIVIGIIVGVFGQIGDFVESLIKRDADAKDSSQLIPGHGGFFDRFDSLLFSSPLIYIYLYYFI
ncbi:MAG: phosphatidate cytidylyltransferase [Ignavibacteria bacterium]